MHRDTADQNNSECGHFSRSVSLWNTSPIWEVNIIQKQLTIYFTMDWFLHDCTFSFKKAWAQALCRFKSCSPPIKKSRWWGSLTMVTAGNKAKHLSSVNDTTKAIHHQFIITIFEKIPFPHTDRAPFLTFFKHFFKRISQMCNCSIWGLLTFLS